LTFNNNFKILPKVFDVWMRLLKQVQGSVLWLLEGNPIASRNLKYAAQERGVGPERIVFAPRLEITEHLARHQLANLFLDTLPYNAHTTASDALWAGLPFLTCKGETFAGRVGASLLHAIGLPELITNSLADYESLALNLATDQLRLSKLREKLFDNREKYPLFDTDLFRRHIESAYTTMWDRYKSGEAPITFSV
jgi:predicted O-linked N-acetylglucosamine transferase (SPINDLY family)